MASTEDRNVVFFDPDNGFEVKSRPRGSRDSSKYLFFDEAAAFFNRGQSLLIYQHFPRVERSGFIQRLAGDIVRTCSGADVQVMRTANVAFFLVIHPRHHYLGPDERAANTASDDMWAVVIPKTLARHLRPLPTSDGSRHNREKDRWGQSVAPNNLTCEIKTDGRWIETAIEEVLESSRKIRLKRCPECYGRVRAHPVSSTGARAHFEHIRDHGGCSRAGKFSGKKSRHWDPLV